jgi:hypothetical protein
MKHQIHRVINFKKVADFVLSISFEDGTQRTIDFRPVLAGELYGPLSDPKVFDQVQIDPEVHTLVWPNGADFDPAILYDWPSLAPEFEELARSWQYSNV